MKINADYRGFNCLDDIINDLTDTIACWSDEKIKDAVEYNMWAYINDWYADYELTEEEEKAVEEMAIEYFAEDTEEEEEEQIPEDYKERIEYAEILVNSPAWDGITDPHDLALRYELKEMKDLFGMMDEAEEEYYEELYKDTFVSLHRLRKKAELTQKQLADTAGVHINIISRIERGERSASKLQLDTAARLAEALGCHAEDLLD